MSLLLHHFSNLRAPLNSTLINDATPDPNFRLPRIRRLTAMPVVLDADVDAADAGAPPQLAQAAVVEAVGAAHGRRPGLVAVGGALAGRVAAVAGHAAAAVRAHVTAARIRQICGQSTTR